MTATELYNTLQTLCENLLFLSESDYPFSIKILDNLTTIDTITEMSQAKQISITDFLQNAATKKEWYDENEKQTVVRYQKLLEFLLNSCQIIAVYKTKPPLATLAALLKAEDKIVVLSTQVVET
jgi:hypothetical protein